MAAHPCGAKAQRPSPLHRRTAEGRSILVVECSKEAVDSGPEGRGMEGTVKWHEVREGFIEQFEGPQYRALLRGELQQLKLWKGSARLSPCSTLSSTDSVGACTPVERVSRPSTPCSQRITATASSSVMRSCGECASPSLSQPRSMSGSSVLSAATPRGRLSE